MCGGFGVLRSVGANSLAARFRASGVGWAREVGGDGVKFNVAYFFSEAGVRA